MPKFKKDETEFKTSVFYSRDRWEATIPKVLMERLQEGAEEITGTFCLTKDKLTLKADQ